MSRPIGRTLMLNGKLTPTGEERLKTNTLWLPDKVSSAAEVVHNPQPFDVPQVEPRRVPQRVARAMKAVNQYPQELRRIRVSWRDRSSRTMKATTSVHTGIESRGQSAPPADQSRARSVYPTERYAISGNTGLTTKRRTPVTTIAAQHRGAAETELVGWPSGRSAST